MSENSERYRLLCTIRRFEETVLENFPKGVFSGTTHTYLGQEANAVGVLEHLRSGDIIFSNHRCHGHFIAYGGELRSLFAELMGKATGVCGGRGGSQHLQWHDFYSNGVQGGIVPVATGMALAEKHRQSGAVVVCFLGDGTLGEGVIYESFNLASLWQAPILFVLEDNQIAQTTPTRQALAGEMGLRLAAFGIPVTELDSSDVLEISQMAGRLWDEIRAQKKPQALILHTQRFGPHSKGDDTRAPQEVARLWEKRDPLKTQAARLSIEEQQAIESEVDLQVAAAFQQALGDPPPEDDGPWIVGGGQLLVGSEQRAVDTEPWAMESGEQLTVLKALNAALHRAMEDDPRVVLIGEDLLDPYGGAFKVTQGLSTAFPDRVWSSPISEAGIVGLGTGMALRGLRPVVEIMFGDFLTLAADQLVNHIAKFRWMYNDQVRVPLVIRTPMGGRRGYGPTHSQTLEKLFLGLPGLKVVAPCALGASGEQAEAGWLLARAIADEDPVLFIENKLLYLSRLQTAETLPDFEIALQHSSPYPSYHLTVQGAPPAVLTMVAYGHMAELAREAALELAYQHEIFVEVVVPTLLSPYQSAMRSVLESVQDTGRLLVAEEGTLTLGWGAEILARTAEALGPKLKVARRVAAHEVPIPAASVLEARVLPNLKGLVATARKMV